MDAISARPAWLVAVVVAFVAGRRRPPPPHPAAAPADEVDWWRAQPVVWVTPSEITFQGQLLASPLSVTFFRHETAIDTLDALYERLDAGTHKILEGLPSRAVPERHGLVVCLADPSYDPRTVAKIINTARRLHLPVLVVDTAFGDVDPTPYCASAAISASDSARL